MKLKTVWISYRSFWFSCEHDLLETKWISAGSLDVTFNAHVRLKLNAGMDFISVILTEMNFHFGYKISCKHYPKWNAYICPSKYRVVLKCSRNETSCEQNLFSRRFEISNRYEFILPLMWTYSYHRIIFGSSQQRCSIKNVVLKISQNSKGNAWVRASFLINL